MESEAFSILQRRISMEPSMIHEALREYKEGIGHFEQELPEVAAE